MCLVLNFWTRSFRGDETPKNTRVSAVSKRASRNKYAFTISCAGQRKKSPHMLLQQQSTVFCSKRNGTTAFYTQRRHKKSAIETDSGVHAQQMHQLVAD